MGAAADVKQVRSGQAHGTCSEEDTAKGGGTASDMGGSGSDERRLRLRLRRTRTVPPVVEHRSSTLLILAARPPLSAALEQASLARVHVCARTV